MSACRGLLGAASAAVFSSLFLFAGLARLPAETQAEAEFPFAYRQGLLWVEVKVFQKEQTLPFVLDTGAEVSVIDRTVLRRLGLSGGPNILVKGVHSTTHGSWPVPLRACVGHIPLPAQMLALDLSAMSRACERPLAGLIGADFFRDRVVRIDFASHRVRLLNSAPAAGGGDTLPLQVRRCGLRTQASINGRKPQWFRLDTGCVSALQWVTSDFRPEECTRKVAIGLTELSIPQTHVTVCLGRSTFAAVPAGLHRQAIFDGEAGLLGNDLLTRFNSITIDTPARRLLLGERRESQ